MESGFHKVILVPADTQEGDNKQNNYAGEGRGFQMREEDFRFGLSSSH